MGETLKNMLIGVFIIAACVLLIGIVMFLKPSVGNGKKILHVRFANINKINVGTRVTYAGKPLGEVIAIEEIHDPRKQPVDPIGRYYVYQLTLKVDSSVVVYNTDDISLATSGLLGEKSVAIVPKKPPKGMTPKLITTQPFYANSIDPIENAFNELSQVSSKMEETLDEVTRWIKENGDTVACAVENFSSALHEADIAISDINESHLIQEIADTAHNMKETVCSIQNILTDLQNEGTFINIAAATRHIRKASRSIEIVSDDLADGKGTLGRLIKFDDLYLRFTSIMSKIDTLMNNINQYGLLFNNNKNWQRTNIRHTNLMNALKTPENFKKYFECEIDNVNQSMSRVSLLIDHAEETPEKDLILQDDLFKKDFADLLRKADELTQNLRLFNQKLVESQKN